jgi:hypothetical protein
MRAQLVLAAVLLTGCTMDLQVRGPYAAALSATDIHEIRRLAQPVPYFGPTRMTLDAIERDRVVVEIRTYDQSGLTTRTREIIRRNVRWQRKPLTEAERELERVVVE